MLNEKQIKKIDGLEDKIKIISPNYLFNNEEKYDLVFNSDSFTEIDTLSQIKYVDFISEKTNYFYSINHECNKIKVSGLF